ncbi:MAG TPA: PA0069 family radical SAM protein [Longimicrobiales bacterium]|nr:PA0069 family radical SAM protein [Longimicrobiales bacterium]
MEAPNLIQIKGRGAAENPPNRFEPIEYVPDMDVYDPDEEVPPKTMVFKDTTKKIIAKNDSPDVGFNYSINPYRGCEHGCIYCYARPGHEYFGLSAGLDFETKIFAKLDAATLLRKEMMADKWKGELIAISGVTDCYQPIERKFQITRSCLEVLLEFRNPCALITKNYLITRDVDILAEMATYDGVGVSVSVTSLRNEIQRVMEPRTSVPAKRLAAIETLAKAGVPVTVMVAPVVPGLTDHEIPAILKAAKDAGAQGAGYITLRLPHGVKELFERWLERHFPERKDKVLNRVRELRSGKLYDPTFGVRMRGEGVFADQIEALFDASVRKLGINQKPTKLKRSSAHFKRPPKHGQLALFE